jgi:hypothetical protein
MSAFFFNILLWIMGVVHSDENNAMVDVKARGKCRQIVVDNNTVKIHFLNPEDAKIFAKDLKAVINND